MTSKSTPDIQIPSGYELANPKAVRDILNSGKAPENEDPDAVIAEIGEMVSELKLRVARALLFYRDLLQSEEKRYRDKPLDVIDFRRTAMDHIAGINSALAHLKKFNEAHPWMKFRTDGEFRELYSDELKEMGQQLAGCKTFEEAVVAIKKASEECVDFVLLNDWDFDVWPNVTARENIETVISRADVEGATLFDWTEDNGYEAVRSPGRTTLFEVKEDDGYRKRLIGLPENINFGGAPTMVVYPVAEDKNAPGQWRQIDISALVGSEEDCKKVG